MPKNRNYAEVNSSYTTFFLISAIGLGLFFGTMLPETRYQASILVVLYVLLLYFVWDFIKQLYSPGQAVFLYATIFIIMPFAMNWLLNFPYARLGSIILIGSFFLAAILESLYEKLIKQRLDRSLSSRILSVDNKIDKSIVQISNKHVYLTEWKGFVFALSLAIIYFSLAYLLFHR